MFALDHDLAQDIVDRAMAILPCNVNVMDYPGIIIGSGEADRLYTRHEGAQLVLANSRVVEIDSHTAKHLNGVRPGVNLPLMLDRRINSGGISAARTCCRGCCWSTALTAWSTKPSIWGCNRNCRVSRY